MTAERRRVTTQTAQSRSFKDSHNTARYMRFSHRYNTWQVRMSDGTFRNVKVPMARAYAAAGFRIGVQAGSEQFEFDFGG